MSNINFAPQPPTISELLDDFQDNTLQLLGDLLVTECFIACQQANAACFANYSPEILLELANRLRDYLRQHAADVAFDCIELTRRYTRTASPSAESKSP